MRGSVSERVSDESVQYLIGIGLGKFGSISFVWTFRDFVHLFRPFREYTQFVVEHNDEEIERAQRQKFMYIVLIGSVFYLSAFPSSPRCHCYLLRRRRWRLIVFLVVYATLWNRYLYVCRLICMYKCYIFFGVCKQPILMCTIHSPNTHVVMEKLNLNHKWYIPPRKCQTLVFVMAPPTQPRKK